MAVFDFSEVEFVHTNSVKDDEISPANGFCLVRLLDALYFGETKE